ncbi:adenylyltransferase/cytidyltransferase family protein, partial [Mesorhizobium sp.]
MTQALERISAVAPLPTHLRGGVVAIGNFDGVHRGHLSVLERALAEAGRRGVPALVLT